MHEHHDVIIVGAGISGVSSAVHLKRALPHRDVVILEKREAIGGTWELFRYPGVRSDSDMFTLGFGFKPWEHPRAIAEGWTIRDYVQAAATEAGIDRAVRFGHRVIAADWDSAEATWTLTCELADGSTRTLSANFVHFTAGYYSYERPYAPEFPGQASFGGRLIHPQHWPEDLDVTGRRVVVIGSGATAMTLVPALAGQAARVTMLQRSPSYVISMPSEDDLANAARRVLPAHTAYSFTRAVHLGGTFALYQFMRRAPKLARRVIAAGQRRMLGEDYPIDVHFNPRYDPWDERLCIVPDSDLFRALKAGTAEIVTAAIDTFTESGIRLADGTELEADIIVTATGLTLELLGGTRLTVDGTVRRVADSVSYKGVMFSDIPNLAMTFGYINASWTLKADLIATYVTRLLAFMEERGWDAAWPLEPPDGERQPFIDLQSGYVRRGAGELPSQGTRDPWLVHQSWFADDRLLRRAPIVDEGIHFARAARAAAPPAPAPEPVGV